MAGHLPDRREEAEDRAGSRAREETAAAARLLADPGDPTGMARWQYRYDGAGRLSQLVYPRRDKGFPTEVTYSYDSGFLTGVSAAIRDPFAATTVETVTGSLSYSPAGSVVSTILSSNGGATRVFSLSTPRDASVLPRLSSWDLTASCAGTPVESRMFAYDPSGNISSISSAAGSDLFFYDTRGRLLRDTLPARPAASKVETREYDGFGNLVSVANGSGTTSFGIVRSTNRLDAPGIIWNSRRDLVFDTVQGRNLGRDDYPDGALTSENVHPPGTVFGDHPAISAWLVDFRGDNALTFYGDGLYCNTELFVASLRGEDRSVLTDYKADVVDSNCDCGVNVCSYAEKFRKDYIQIGPWARVTYARGEGTAFWALDHLGTSRTRLNKFGDVVSSLRLDSFGQELSATPGERHRFTGHERNHVSVLDGPQFPISDFMHARTYVPMLGRFTRPDPANSFSLFNPQSLNRYSYGLNNPTNVVDPDGRVPVRLIWDGFKAGWGWAEHVVIRHIRTDIPKWSQKSKWLSEDVARDATERVFRSVKPITQTDGKLFRQADLGTALGPKGETVARVVTQQVGTDAEALVTSFASRTMKVIGVVGMVIDPWSEASAANQTETMIPNGYMDPRFTTTSAEELNKAQEDESTSGGKNDVGVPKLVRVYDANGWHFEFR